MPRWGAARRAGRCRTRSVSQEAQHRTVAPSGAPSPRPFFRAGRRDHPKLGISQPRERWSLTEMTMRNTPRKRFMREAEAEELAEWMEEDPGFTPEFIAQRERESRRMVNTAMQFWRACPQPKCR